MRDQIIQVRKGPFPKHVDFFNEKGQLIRQPVQYEWLPTKCIHCQCRKKIIRKEWRPKESMNADSHKNPNGEVDKTITKAPQVNTLPRPSKEIEPSQPGSISANTQAGKDWAQSTSSTIRDQPIVHPIVHPNPFQILEEAQMEERVPPDPHE
ncbi:hypothetical protein Cgig2_017245 [Carnegiea gigantea]|uniref:Uncharacterized protein n=1 Tax=Carnegiea gigantea TaxID=171969 RepID=A0A9Q1GX58_9CARY|nr:hypothetical protein Cgig2_017245 [Carnegiea gigantea]